MFGFKKTVSVEDFGQGALHLATDPLMVDAVRSLALGFEDLPSSNLSTALKDRGVSEVDLSTYKRFYVHASLQAALLQFDKDTSIRAMRSAMSMFNHPLPLYDFNRVYSDLQNVHDGAGGMGNQIDSLTNDAILIDWLPPQFQNAGARNAKFLIWSLLVPNDVMTGHYSILPDTKLYTLYLQHFDEFSSKVAMGIGTVNRAIMHLAKSFKFK